MIKKVLILVLMLTITIGAFGQSLEENLSSMLNENATLYIQPLGDAFGASMNSGWYHRSRVHKMLGFDISVKLLGAVVTDENKYFDFVLNENTMEFDLNSIVPGQNIAPVELTFADIYYETDTQTPTFFGPSDPDSAGALVVADNHLVELFSDHLLEQLTADMGAAAAQVVVSGAAAEISNFVANIEDLPLPPGSGLPGLALPMPQISLGLPMGIELTIRGFPEAEIPDVGMFSMYGGGARLNLDQFIPIPLFPVDITAGAFYSQMSVGDILESSNTSVGLQVGKSISLLFFGVGVYADAAYEMSSLSIGYDVDPALGIENDRVSFDMETDPGLRLGVGLHITAVPLTYLNVHISQTPTNQTLTLAAGITLR